jgi:hypothetical protein
MADNVSVRTQIGWQVFHATGERSHELLSGRWITLVEYRSHCATCGAPYEAAATKGAWRKREVARRCDRCRSPGVHVDNLCPPVPLRSLPFWARPMSDPKKLAASLGRRRHNCWFLRGKRLRIIEPDEAMRLKEAAHARFRAEFAAEIAAKRAAPTPTPVSAEDLSYLD